MRDPLANDQRLDDTLGDGLADALEDWASRTPKLAHEARTALRFDPASAAIKLAQGGIGEQYLVYERAGTWYFAAGPAAEVSVSSDTLHLRVGQWHRSVPVDDPVEAVATALASLRRHGLSRCYGWATFELAFLLHEDRTSTGSDTLIHLMLPEVEVQLDGNAVHTRTSIRGMIARITALLRTEPITSDAIPISIEEPDFASYEKMVATAIGEIKSRAFYLGLYPFPLGPGSTCRRLICQVGVRTRRRVHSFLTSAAGRQLDSVLRPLWRLTPLAVSVHSRWLVLAHCTTIAKRIVACVQSYSVTRRKCMNTRSLSGSLSTRRDR